MSHRQVLLCFAQQDLEPFFLAWWRFKDLLIRFPFHGFSKECQLEIFLSGLCAITRHWVERGDGTTSFFQRSIDEAYWLLEDIAEIDRWNWDCSMNNQGWENNSTIMEPWYNTRPQHVESSPDLQALVAQFSEETKLRLEKLERMEVLRQLEAELAQIQVELSRMNAPTNDSIEAMKRKASMVDFYKELEASSQFHHDEPTPHEEERELFEDDSSREEETQDLYIDEESQEEVYESRPLEISIVMPPPINHNHIYVEWPAPPPPTLASFLHTHRAHPSKSSLVGATCQHISHLAKLERNHNQDPYEVLYDTYYGRSHSLMSTTPKSQADDYKSSTPWEVQAPEPRGVGNTFCGSEPLSRSIYEGSFLNPSL